MIIERLSVVFKRPVLAAFLCFVVGSLCALAMAPLSFWPVFLVGFGGVYCGVAFASNAWRAFVCAWCFGFGYHVFGLYWIGNALLVEGNDYAWAWPLAVCGLPALLAVFTGLAGLVVHKVCDLRQWHGYLGFTAIFAGFEWLRGHVFTGFPWNLYGYTWEGVMEIAQVAAFHDIYGLTWLSVFWFGIAGFLLIGQCRQQKIFMSICVVLSFALVFALGWLRLNQQELIYHEGVTVKIVQPNTPQHEKWQADKMATHFETALDLSRDSDADQDENVKTIIVWPETTLSPRYLSSDNVLGSIAWRLRQYPGDAVLLTGALRHEDGAYYNSLVAVDDRGAVFNVYDKRHLVPFGEYIPFQKWIPLTPVAQFTGFEKGSDAGNYAIFDTLKYSVQVCYEIIFPHGSYNGVDNGGEQSDFIVNVTNDAWYGISPGPYQHLTQARFRAIETGVSVIRAANTGFSTLIGPRGEILTTGNVLFDSAVYTAPLPHKLSVYAKNPYAQCLQLLGLFSILIGLALVMRKRQDVS